MTSNPAIDTDAPRRRRGFFARAVALLAVWIVIAGTDTVDLVVGVMAALLAAWASIDLLPAAHWRFRPLALVRLSARLLVQSVVAGVNVAMRALDPRMPLKPGFVVYRPALPPGPGRNAFCTMTSLLPGTLPCGTDEEGAVVIHCLDLDEPVKEQYAAEEAIFLQALERVTAMASFLVGAAVFILAMVAFGLSRILHGPGRVERMMAAQLIGSGGVAVLMLLAVSTRTSSVIDVALMLALLAAFASVGFVKEAYATKSAPSEEAGKE